MPRWLELDTSSMTRAEWESARSHGIGGSDAAAIVGLNKYASPYSLWAQKTRRVIAEDISHKEAVRLGVYLEPYVAQRFTEETGIEVYEKHAILRNPDYPWALANVDRLVAGDEAGLECKTTSAMNLRSFKGGEYPANYYVQCVHYMAVTGCKYWYLAVLIGNNDFRWFKIDRDEDEIATLMEAERNFWQHVQDGTEPPMIGAEADGETVSALYPQGDGSAIELFGREAMLRQYISIKGQEDALKAQREAIAAEIKKDMGEAEKALATGFRVSWGNRVKRTFEERRYLADHPGSLDGYYKTTPYRAFEIKEEK